MMESVTYRMDLAEGFLKEALQDMELKRWRACVANAQLAVENALKAVIGLFIPIPKTHDPARVLMELVSQRQISMQWAESVQKLATAGKPLGPQVHVQTDYGDEYSGLTPWELFNEQDAREAIEVADEIIDLAEAIIRDVRHEHK